MVYPTLWFGGTAECVDRPPLSLVPAVSMSVKFLWLCRLPLRSFLVCVFCWMSYWLWPRHESYGRFMCWIIFPRMYSEAVPGVVPSCCATSLDSPLSWPPPSPVLLPTTVAPCSGTAHATTVLARPPAAAPAGGCVACRVPATGLPPSSPMPRGPPPRAPPLFPSEYVLPDGNRLGVDS
jgi:hypothetical protein